MSIAITNHGDDDYVIILTSDDRIAESDRRQTLALKAGESHLVFTKYATNIEVRRSK